MHNKVNPKRPGNDQEGLRMIKEHPKNEVYIINLLEAMDENMIASAMSRFGELIWLSSVRSSFSDTLTSLTSILRLCGPRIQKYAEEHD